VSGELEPASAAGSAHAASAATTETDFECVMITGACGNLGRRLVRRLHRRCKVVALDRRVFPGRPKDVEHHEVDLRRQRVKEVFRQRGLAALVHLGVMHNPQRGSEEHHTWNVAGFQKLMQYAQQFGLKKVVLLSSANVYGPRPDNPQFLAEEAPLMGAGRFSEMRDLVELDMCAQSHVWRADGPEVVILRPTHILGGVQNAPSNYLRLKRVPTVLGFDPMLQVVHQDDVLQAIELALAPGVRGVYNIAGPAGARLSKMLELLKRTSVPLPASLARLGLDGLFRWKMSSFPAPELDFIRYVCMVDDTKARRELGYTPGFDLEQTLRAVDAERWIA
jgi:UDP-glucose 4-epimerase